jgi:hypothetical protein
MLSPRLTHHLTATAPLPAAKVATILQHCSYMLEHRGLLYDFEQVLLLRVTRQLAAPATAGLIIVQS